MRVKNPDQLLQSIPQLSRRRMLKYSAAAAGVGLGVSSTNASSAQDSQVPQRGGALRIALTEDPLNLDPYGPGGAWAKRNVLRGMFDTLVFYDEDGAWVPSMAESWEVQEDGSVLQFTLRPGMTFHDGSPCDAEAVKWTIDNLWLDPEVGLAALKDRFTGAEVVDPQTIRLLLTQPDVTSFATLADQFIVSPTAYQELGPDEFALNPVGSGPYSFESWRQGSELTQVRFDGYWDAERPYPDSLVWKPLPEDTVRMINLTEGEVDVATFIPDAEVETMQSTDGIEVGMQLGGYVGVMFNMVDPPFDQLANREALLLAIDYDALNSAVFFGFAETATGGFVPPSNYAFNDQLPTLQRDLDQARAKLEEAGNPAGFTFVAMPEAGDASASRMLEVIQATVGEVGIEMTIEGYDRGRFTEILTQDRRAVQMAQYRIAYIHPVPENRLAFASCGAGYNFPEWCNEEFDTLLADARASADQAEEIQFVQQAEQILIDDKAFSSLAWIPTTQAWRTSVHDFQVDHVGDAGWQRAWIES